MSEDGQLLKCDRCDKSVFLKTIEPKQLAGGFTTVEQYESRPTGWGRDTHHCKDLCPNCMTTFKDMFKDFYGRAKED